MAADDWFEIEDYYTGRKTTMEDIAAKHLEKDPLIPIFLSLICLYMTNLYMMELK